MVVSPGFGLFVQFAWNIAPGPYFKVDVNVNFDRSASRKV